MTRPDEPLSVTSGEYSLYTALTIGLCAAYLLGSFVLPLRGSGVVTVDGPWFGFSQFGWAGLPLTLAILALVVVRACSARATQDAPSPGPELSRRGPWTRAAFILGIGLCASAIFFLLRNEFVNTDGGMFASKFARLVRKGETPVTHDEMWEFYVHSRWWMTAHEWWGWRVKLTYQVSSCLAGGMFVLLLLEYCRLISPKRPWVTFLLCASGGYVQLFFGDVENYTLATTLVMAYLLASTLFLRGRIPLWQPSILLATAMMFHLVAGFLALSLAYLGWVAWRAGDRRAVMVAGAAFVAVIAGTLGFFHWNGLPISRLFSHSHAFGDGGDFRRMLVSPSVPYYLSLLNLMMLLVPSVVLLVPLLWYRRISLDRENLHLALACGCMMAFVFGWNARLGVYQDWNLFAPAALPISLLVWRNVANLQVLRGRFRPIPVLGALGATHSLAWVVANHFNR